MAKEAYHMAKEAYHMAKEAYHTAKEAYHTAKETYQDPISTIAKKHILYQRNTFYNKGTRSIPAAKPFQQHRSARRAANTAP